MDTLPVNSLSYTISAADTIVAVSGHWDEFALQNEGENIVASQVIGKKLEQFIHGDETLMFVRAMIMSARVLQRPVLRPYRCDSPSLKRFMEMTVQPLAQGAVEVSHRALRSEPITPPVRIVAAPVGAGMAFTKRCSVCNRVKAQNVWSEFDAAVQAQRSLLQDAMPLRVIYGVCPDCQSSLGR